MSETATLIAEKIDAAGAVVRQIDLCPLKLRSRHHRSQEGLAVLKFATKATPLTIRLGSRIFTSATIPRANFRAK